MGHEFEVVVWEFCETCRNHAGIEHTMWQGDNLEEAIEELKKAKARGNVVVKLIWRGE